MADLRFTDQETILLSSWLNGVNQLVYSIFLDPDTIDDVVLLLPEATQERKGLINGPDQEKVNDIDSAFRIAGLEVESITASRTLDDTDAYKFFRVNSASEVTITVPQEGSTSFSIGEYAYFEKAGTGNITFSPGPGVSVNTTTSLSISDQYLVVGLIKIGVNTWTLFGNRQSEAELLAFGILDLPGFGIYDTTDFSRFADPVDQASSGLDNISFRPDGTEVVALGTDSGQFRYSLPGLTSLTDYPDVFGNGGACEFSKDGTRLVLGTSIYNTATTTKITDLSVPSFHLVETAAYNNDDTLLAVGFGSNPGLQVHDTSDFSLVPGAPTVTDFVIFAEFSPDGSQLAIAILSSPFIRIYNTSDWSEITSPAVLPTGAGQALSYSSDGNFLAIAHNVSPYVTIYNTTGFVKLANPSVLPPFDAYSIDFNGDGSLLAVGHDDSPFITIYNTSDYSKVANPSSLPNDRVSSIRFSG